MNGEPRRWNATEGGILVPSDPDPVIRCEPPQAEANPTSPAGTLFRDWRDIGFYAMATEVTEYHVEIEVYRIVGADEDGRPIFDGTDDRHFRGVSSTDDPRVLVFLSGSVKWDECSNWDFDVCDHVKIHFCSRAEAANLGTLMGRLYDWAAELIPRWGC